MIFLARGRRRDGGKGSPGYNHASLDERLRWEMRTRQRSNRDLNLGRDPEIHAIGMIALQWNLAETALEDLIWLYLDTDKPTARIVTRPMGNVARTTLLRHLVSEKEIDPSIIDAVLYAASCYDICRENRNHIVHGQIQNLDPGIPFRLVKHRKQKPIEDNLFELTIEELRDLANEIHYTKEYIIDLREVLSPLLVLRRQMERDVDDPPDPPETPELPDKPNQPPKLSPRPVSTLEGSAYPTDPRAD